VLQFVHGVRVYGSVFCSHPVGVCNGGVSVVHITGICRWVSKHTIFGRYRRVFLEYS
jgi:hypothetical protein